MNNISDRRRGRYMRSVYINLRAERHHVADYSIPSRSQRISHFKRVSVSVYIMSDEILIR
jgi:hypothetical protein